jgi:RNA-directed DNA polymerase
LSLPTPSSAVEKLRTSLQTKAKTEPAFRFYSLWDKICRADVLLEAYRRCHANAGAAGVDGVTFEQIEAQGVERWLEKLREELLWGRYAPKPLLRVWIPKSNGGQRPLGIPTIYDRVVQMAVVLVIGPIFETDLLPQQYGFRPGMDAKMALRRVYWHVTEQGRREVVDADLRDYFTSIPHSPLMRSLARRIADGRVLKTVKRWMTAPVVEHIDGRLAQTAEARNTKRGTPQGGVISPMLANLYFRRFVLAWQLHGHQQQLNAHIVNYADDFVICCPPGNAEVAMTRMQALMARLGLEVNTTKTRIARLPEESFNFLGYTVGGFYGKAGRRYIGTCPSRKAVRALLKRIHERTSSQWYANEPQITVDRISSLLCGWCGYFNQGPVIRTFEFVRRYTERRIRRWLMRRTGRDGTGFAQIPDKHLYETLGLYAVPTRRADLSRTKV